MEAGVFALNRLRVRRLARMGNAQAQILHGFLEKPEKFLWTILVGNTLVNFFILGWVHREAARLVRRPDRSDRGAVHGHRVCVLFVFDLLPKMLFRAYPNRLCLASAHAVRLVHLALRRGVLVEGISRDRAALARRRGRSPAGCSATARRCAR